VIDLKGGMAVHAVGGRREQYRPLRSIWQASGSPIALLDHLVDGLGLDRVYIADLDAIENGRADVPLYERLAHSGSEIWLDAGASDVSSVRPMLAIGSSTLQIVVGLETVGGAGALGEIVAEAGVDRVVFSVDLDHGRPRVASGSGWDGTEPLEIVGQAVSLGVTRLILLDLPRVGTGLGAGTESLLARIKDKYPALAVTVGGGIRNSDEILALRSGGASSVLVGTAIHDGRIGPEDIRRLAMGLDGAGSDPT
jgi:phosphoribosylformimino-5-aminoimidazole carboxamide ribotide isomerase